MFSGNQSDWDDLFRGRSANLFPASDKVTAKFVAKKERERDSYGDYYQGEGEVYVIFEVNGKYYKKSGYMSSYGDGITWDGTVVEVTPKTVEVVVWE